MPVITIPISNTGHDVSTTEGGPFNFEWEGSFLQHGTHKSGVHQPPHLRFNGINIPPTSVINSASIELEATALGAGVLDIPAQVRLLAKDGAWNAEPNVPDQWTASSSDDDWHVELLDVTTQLVITGPQSSANQGGPQLRGDSGNVLKRCAQGVTVTVAGNITIARVSLGGPFAAPSNNMWVEIYDDNAGLPGTLLGTSATRPNSDVPLRLIAQNRETYDFAFSGGDVVTVAINDVIHVVMRTDHLAIEQGIHLGTWRYAYAGGDMAPFGESPAGGYDQQNYLTVDDLLAIAGVGAVIPWTITMALGLQSTPNIGALVQAQIDAGGYLYTDPIGFRLERTAPGTGSDIIWSSFTGAGQPAELTVDFTAPATLVIPNVVGLLQVAAELAIVAAGFTVGTVTFENNAAPAGEVISQSPIGGISAAPFALVDIVVSLGPADDEPVFNRAVPNAAMIRRIQQADHELFLMIVAFLQIKDDY